MRVKKPFVCLFCSKNFRAKAAAKRHSCESKEAAERRLGVPLAVYDAVQRAIEIEYENEKGR
jgi:hypothetical protein